MSTFKSIVKSTATVFAGLTLASAASAATFNFDLQAPTSSVNKSGSYADQYNYSVDGVGMSVTGSRYTGSGFVDEKVGIFNGYGMGVEQASGSQHTLDNNGGIDILTFTFEQEMVLNSVTSGWHTNDSDITVFSVNGGSYNRVGDYYNLVDDVAMSVNATELSSKVWAVTAYTGHTNDYVKLSFLNFSDVASVPAPAPATLGLMSIVLAGLGLRKRARKAA